MNKLRLGLPLVIFGSWLVAAGCDDDRGVVDLGAGGTDGQEQGGAGAGGEPANPGGAGASGGTVAGGSGGAAGGAGGAEECPTDVEADGTPCSTEGKECLIGSDDPCGFGQFLTCFGGEWQHQEAFPAECGGAGGAGGVGGSAGAGGAN